MDRVDELNQEAIKFNRYQQQVIRQQQDKHRFLQKRVRLYPLLHFLSSCVGLTSVLCICHIVNKSSYFEL
jgi:hypothetical protein